MLQVEWIAIFVGLLFPLELFSIPLSSLEGSEHVESNLTCDPLEAEGTAILCFPPDGNVVATNKSDDDNRRNCSHPSIPGTIASYSCRNAGGDVFTGFLNCANSGVWIISLIHANNSLCNLDASIVNFEVPDVVIATDVPGFTTPAPNKAMLQEDVSFLNEHEKTALLLHNIFRRNHGVPLVRMTKSVPTYAGMLPDVPLLPHIKEVFSRPIFCADYESELNNLAQQLVDSLTSSGDIDDLESNFQLNPIHRTMNLEMNWYFQVPSSPDFVEAVSTAIQVWYSGFRKYDWEQLETNLETGEALAFSRVIWKATQLMGIGVASSHNITFVACVYTPGRNIISTDPVSQFKLNVPHFRIGTVVK